jgi:ACS family allantoate permease-like MFS transporter
MLFTGMWYKKTEQGSRTGLWTACNSIGGIFGAAIAYALYDADDKAKLSLPGWKVIYILLGVTTVFFGLLFFFLVPDRPEKAWFLSADDKVIARERLVNNHSSVDREPFRMYQVREALTDPLFYLYSLISIITCIPNGGITNFSAILIKGFGFDTRQTLLLGIANATLAIWIIGFMFLADKLRNRCAMAFAPLLISIAGTAMIWGIPASNRIARLVGFYLVLPYAVPNILALSLVITNVAGRTKKTFYNGMFMVCYCAGNLIGPQTFRQEHAPTYVPAMITLIVCNAVVMVLFAALWYIYARRNRERQAALEAGSVPPEEDIGKDLTDMENPHFRYTI